MLNKKPMSLNDTHGFFILGITMTTKRRSTYNTLKYTQGVLNGLQMALNLYLSNIDIGSVIDQCVNDLNDLSNKWSKEFSTNFASDSIINKEVNNQTTFIKLFYCHDRIDLYNYIKVLSGTINGLQLAKTAVVENGSVDAINNLILDFKSNLSLIEKIWKYNYQGIETKNAYEMKRN